MSALEDVLAAHRVNYHHRNVGPEPVTAENLRYTSCEGCDWLGGHRDEAGWEAHVAAAVTAWITGRLQDEDVREAVARSVRNRLRVGPIQENTLSILASGSVTSLTGTEADEAADAALAAVTAALREGA